jgi:hypothetical protein
VVRSASVIYYFCWWWWPLFASWWTVAAKWMGLLDCCKRPGQCWKTLPSNECVVILHYRCQANIDFSTKLRRTKKWVSVIGCCTSGNAPKVVSERGKKQYCEEAGSDGGTNDCMAPHRQVHHLVLVIYVDRWVLKPDGESASCTSRRISQ